MNKETWARHIQETEGFTFPINREAWNTAVRKHRENKCAICAVRKKTYLASVNRKAREDAMRSIGLVKVRGAVSGKTYWE